MPGLIFTVSGCIYLMVLAAYLPLFLPNKIQCLDSGIAKDFVVA